MKQLAPSEQYALAAALSLLLMTMFNSALLMLIVSILGLAAGFWIVRRGAVRPVAFIAFAAFAVAAVFAVVGLVRGS